MYHDDSLREFDPEIAHTVSSQVFGHVHQRHGGREMLAPALERPFHAFFFKFIIIITLLPKTTSTTSNLPLHFNKPNANKFLQQQFLKNPSIKH